MHLIYGTLDNRDPKELGAAFVGLADEVRTVPIPGDHATLAPADAAARLREIGLTAAPAQGVAAALADLTKKNAPEGRVLICGSLYLAGSVLGENG